MLLVNQKMSFLESYSLLLAVLSAALLPGIPGEFVEQVARVTATEGRVVYIPVPRGHLQTYLDSFERVKGPKLHIPEGPVFSNQPEGTHPIRIDVANIVFNDFEESESNLEHHRGRGGHVSTEGVEVTIDIPYLSHSEEGPADFSLGIMLFYNSQRGFIPKPDFIYPYVGVDDITLDDDRLVAQIFGQGSIVINFEPNQECGDEEQGGEGEEEHDLQFAINGVSELGDNLYFCSKYRHENQFCSRLDGIDEGLLAADPNVCIEWNSGNEKFCEIPVWSAHIHEISGFFKFVIGYVDGVQPIHVEQYEGDYDIGAKFPCL